MEALWKAAISLTGVAGVGAFVLYALYKDWMRLEAVSTLTRPQRFSLFKLFLILTFLFGLAALGLGAYQSHLDKQAAQASAAELLRLLNDRHEAGIRLIAEYAESAPPEEQTKLQSFKTSYEAQVSAVRGALANGDLVRYHELYKQLILSVEELESLSKQQKTRFTGAAIR